MWDDFCVCGVTDLCWTVLKFTKNVRPSQCLASAVFKWIVVVVVSQIKQLFRFGTQREQKPIFYSTSSTDINTVVSKNVETIVAHRAGYYNRE